MDCKNIDYFWSFALREHRPYLVHLCLFSFVDWKKKVQRESCELSFIWGKVRTIAWETAFQITLRNCSKEVSGGGQDICDSGEGGVHAVKCILFAEGCC